MKWTANAGIIVVLIVTLLGVYRIRASVHDRPDAGRENTVLKIVTRVKSGRTESIKLGTTEVDMNGKKTRIDFPGTDTNEVEVRLAPSIRFSDDRPVGTFWVTIKAEEPALLTKTTYDKIEIGMMYPQVGQALGGVMTKGRLSDGFWSKLELIQGKSRVYLTFADGKVTVKSAKDLE